ncbi:hypothetical protein D3C87_2059860 [compost metagenome]
MGTADYNCAYQIAQSNKKLTKVAEGVILISLEHIFAYFEDRPASLAYCQQIERDYLEEATRPLNAVAE